MSFGYYIQRPSIQKFFTWDGEESTRLAMEETYGRDFVLEADGSLTHTWGSIQLGETLLHYPSVTPAQLEEGYQIVSDSDLKEYQLV